MKKKLLTFLFALCALAGWAQNSSPYTGVALGDIQNGESYYLYNVDFRTWLGDNHRNAVYGWTSHAEIGSRGRDIQFIKNGDGWQLNPKLGNNHSINSSNLYMDTSDAVTVWTITAVENSVSNAVKIKNGNQGLSVNDGGDMDQNSNSGENHNCWQIVSREERIAYAENNATAANPVDMSWAILGGTFPVADDHRLAAADGDYKADRVWSDDRGDNSVGGWDWSDGLQYPCVSVWEMWSITNRDVYQTISNIPNGIYRVRAQAVYVSSAGDGISIDHYNAYKAGTEKTLGKIYANDASTNMINAYDLTTETEIANKSTKKLGDNLYVSDGRSQFARRMFADNVGWTEYIPIEVTDNKIKTGVKVENASNAWIMFDNFTLEYLGEANLIAVCEAENTDNDQAFATAINNAKNDASAIDALRTARKRHAADKVKETFTGSAVAAGNFYIYNVGEKKFLCGGNDWGAHASLGFTAKEVTLIENGGNYRIQSHLANGNEGTNDFLNHAGYMDTNSGDTWTFLPVDGKENVYNIAKSSNNSELLGYNGGTYNNVITTCATKTQETNQWMLITKAERDALLANATPATPVDATYYIKRPGFDQRDYDKATRTKEGDYPGIFEMRNTAGEVAWTYEYTGTGGRGVWDQGGNHPDFVFESWNDATLDLHQTITGLRPGKYKVSVQGYTRNGNREQQVQDVLNNSVKTDGAQLYANGATSSETNIMPVTDAINKAPGEGWLSSVGYFPDGCTAAATYFEYGLYKHEIEVVVGTNRELKIGVKMPQADRANAWLVVDNFRLTYLGGETITLNAACTDGEKVYGTYSSTKPFVVPENLTVSTIAVSDQGVLSLTPYNAGEVVKANTGVMVSATAGGSYVALPSSETGTSHDGNALRATGSGIDATTMASKDANSTFYRLTMHNGNQIGFWWGAEDGAAFALGANKAYLAVPKGSSAKINGMWFGDNDTDGIESLNVNPNLNGKFIENGRVVIMRNGVKYNVNGQVIK